MERQRKSRISRKTRVHPVSETTHPALGSPSVTTGRHLHHPFPRRPGGKTTKDLFISGTIPAPRIFPDPQYLLALLALCPSLHALWGVPYVFWQQCQNGLLVSRRTTSIIHNTRIANAASRTTPVTACVVVLSTTYCPPQILHVLTLLEMLDYALQPHAAGCCRIPPQ